jgi:Tfp pilus assembly PilM family ATPase
MDKLRRIDLNSQQYNNLIQFMDRVNMAGAESKAYVDLMAVIESADYIDILQEKAKIDYMKELESDIKQLKDDLLQYEEVENGKASDIKDKMSTPNEPTLTNDKG